MGAGAATVAGDRLTMEEVIEKRRRARLGTNGAGEDSRSRYLCWSTPLLESRYLYCQTTPSLCHCNLLYQRLPLLPSIATNLSARPFFLPCFTSPPLLSIGGRSLNLNSTLWPPPRAHLTSIDDALLLFAVASAILPQLHICSLPPAALILPSTAPHPVVASSHISPVAISQLSLSNDSNSYDVSPTAIVISAAPFSVPGVIWRSLFTDIGGLCSLQQNTLASIPVTITGAPLQRTCILHTIVLPCLVTVASASTASSGCCVYRTCAYHRGSTHP
ncbi:hypothetical protein B296_00019966 [Ensete ventricosum]|uniref:Uncharacterized protein n=1 Tax=Ensete ventricosum TaxID=4639 RepID=A0A426Y557_ENSVE|nr:hypothetical protein B296_00019966 [Ensete ventricosum]